MFKIDILTLFPNIFIGPLTETILKRAQEKGIVDITVHDLRRYTKDKHRTADDKPYGGGPGMLLKPEPIFSAIAELRSPKSKLILMSPQGVKLTQPIARQLAREEHLLFICGHYEGIDERVRTGLKPLEISIGDYVLTNGSLAAVVVIDAVVRLLKGVLGNSDSSVNESFSENLLDYPQYTRPYEYNNMKVPDELVGGNHKKISKWRTAQAQKRTRERRPDLLN